MLQYVRLLNCHQNGQKRHTVVYDFKRTNSSGPSLINVKKDCVTIHVTLSTSLYILYGKSDICRSLVVNFMIFEILKMISIHATTSGQVCCGIILIARINLNTPFLSVFVVCKMKETVDVITRLDFVLL